MPPKTTSLHIASKVSSVNLLSDPDIVLQTMSLKIFQKRDELIKSLINTRVAYDVSGTIRHGVLERIDDTSAFLRDGGFCTKVNIKSLLV